MKYIILTLTFIGITTLAMAQQQVWWFVKLPPMPPRPIQQELEPEPYPGWNSHAEPPTGWMCMNQSFKLDVPKDHVCNCERGCDATGIKHEDPKCTVYCHMDHCGCPIAHADLCPVPDPAIK